MWRILVVSIWAGCGAASEDCVVEGEGYDLKLEPGGPCCDGLTAANTTEMPGTDGACVVEDLNSAKVCIACGDGACGEAENACNCPDDCS